MKYKLLGPNKIKIGYKIVDFPNATIIDNVESFNKIICFNTTPSEANLDWSSPETHQIWKERCLANPSQLFCYDYSGNLKWQLPDDNVVGFSQVFPKLMKEEDFITPEHYARYIEKYKNKELLEVYVGNFRLVIDANTGEICDKMESR